MPIRKDFYIQILSYAHHKREFLLHELSNELSFSNEEKHLFERMNKNVFRLIETGGRKVLKDGENEGEHAIFTISPEGEFNLLEYIELQEARKDAKTAKTYAIISIGISIFTVGVSVIVQLYTASQPIKLDSGQISSFLESYSKPVVVIKV